VTRLSAPTVSSTATATAAAVLGLALAVRLLLFPFAENKQSDAPMRALIAERMNADSAAAADPRSFCQFGPLPIELLRPFLAVDSDARRSSRVLSLIAGLASFWPFFALGRRMVGRGAALSLAGVGLALSPLHIQASTTAASETLYLLVWLAALDRLHAAVTDGWRRDYLYAGLLASLAAVTRYDSWLAVPAAIAAVLVFGRRDRRAVADLALFGAAAASLPMAYLAWSWAKSGDPFFFARYITRDHASLAQAVAARFGPVLSRIRQIAIWLVSFAAAMVPSVLNSMTACERLMAAIWPRSSELSVSGAAPDGVVKKRRLSFENSERSPAGVLTRRLRVRAARQPANRARGAHRRRGESASAPPRWRGIG